MVAALLKRADVQLLLPAIDPTPGLHAAAARWLETGVEIISDADFAWELFSELVAASPCTLRHSIDDAHLAAIAIAHGATLASFESYFGTFVAHGLRWERLSST